MKDERSRKQDSGKLLNRRFPTVPASPEEAAFQARIVKMIAVARKPEEALDALCAHYRIERPSLRIGLPKGERRALGCYVHRDRTIYMSNEEYLFDPYVLIHEFYHHLRYVGGKHRGTERHARNFAIEFLNNAEDALSKGD